MDDLYTELKRRKVITSVLLYAMAVWLILQVADVVVEPLLLPSWLPRAIIVGSIIGFPVVVLVSWFFDLKKYGIVATDDIERKPIGFSVLFALFCGILLLSSVIAQRWGMEAEIESAIVSEELIVEEPEVISLGILPLQVAPNVEQLHLIQLAEELSGRLSLFNRIRLAPVDALQLLPANSSYDEIANRLGVRYILSGTVNDVEGAINLQVSLYDQNRSEEVWSDEFQQAQLYVVNDLVVERTNYAVGDSGPRCQLCNY